MTGLRTIPLATPDLRGNEARYLAECVADNWVSTAGPRVGEMERRVGELTGRRFAIATVNGTTAIQLALMAAGVRAGDLVIVPDWTFAASAAAIHHAGAEAYFVDVDGATWTLDPALVRRAIAEAPRRVGAVLAVHACGQPADMEPLIALCREMRLPLIEDAAGAIGASYRGRPVGALGDVSIFSFNGNKTVTAGGGGMAMTDDAEIAQRIRHLSTTARIGTRYEHDAIGYNFRMTNLNAAVGVAQLERLSEMLAAKRRIAARYDAAMKKRRDLEAMPRSNWAESSCWLYTVRTASAETAHAMVEHLERAGIEARVFWQSLSAQAPYATAPRLLAGVAADRLSGRCVSLPCSSHLTDQDQDRVLAAMAEFSGPALDVQRQEKRRA